MEPGDLQSQNGWFATDTAVAGVAQNTNWWSIGTNGAEITRATFYTSVQAGRTVVNARGDLTREGFWREVELEGDDD